LCLERKLLNDVRHDVSSSSSSSSSSSDSQ
jgi:hypothetical protein